MSDEIHRLIMKAVVQAFWPLYSVMEHYQGRDLHSEIVHKPMFCAITRILRLPYLHNGCMWKRMMIRTQNLKNVQFLLATLSRVNLWILQISAWSKTWSSISCECSDLYLKHQRPGALLHMLLIWFSLLISSQANVLWLKRNSFFKKP